MSEINQQASQLLIQIKNPKTPIKPKTHKNPVGGFLKKPGFFWTQAPYTPQSGILSLVMADWLNCNVIRHIIKVTLRRARLVLRWMTVRGTPSGYLTKPPRPTHLGLLFMGRCYECQRWLQPPL